jgi:hypothetical protein
MGKGRAFTAKVRRRKPARGKNKMKTGKFGHGVIINHPLMRCSPMFCRGRGLQEIMVKRFLTEVFAGGFLEGWQNRGFARVCFPPFRFIGSKANTMFLTVSSKNNAIVFPVTCRAVLGNGHDMEEDYLP